MKVWGQWIENGSIYSVIMNKDWRYRFNHWNNPEEYHGPNEELVKHPRMKFRFQLIF